MVVGKKVVYIWNMYMVNIFGRVKMVGMVLVLLLYKWVEANLFLVI